MPSLPVDNKSLASNEDAYRRYFGRLKQHSVIEQSRPLLCNVTAKICFYSTIASIPNYIMLYFFYQLKDIYKDHQLYYLYDFTQMLITFIWCISVIYVIFKNKYSNLRIIIFNAFIISLLSLTTSMSLSYVFYHHHTNQVNPNKNIFNQHYWRLDFVYFVILRFPLTLYFSILIMYFSEHCCSSFCTFTVTSRMDSVEQNKMLRAQLIQVDDTMAYSNEDAEIYEYQTNATGMAYGDDSVEFSVDTTDEKIDINNNNNNNLINFNYNNNNFINTNYNNNNLNQFNRPYQQQPQQQRPRDDSKTVSFEQLERAAKQGMYVM